MMYLHKTRLLTVEEEKNFHRRDLWSSTAMGWASSQHQCTLRALLQHIFFFSSFQAISVFFSSTFLLWLPM
jgi:hypothetical protein